MDFEKTDSDFSHDGTLTKTPDAHNANDVTKAAIASDVNQSEITIRQPGRTIVVEPLMFFMAFAFMPLMMVSNLYVYGHFQQTLCQHETDVNCAALSDANSASKSCSSHATNTSSPEYIFTQKVQRTNAQFNMFMNLASAIPAFFATLFLSPYSDKAGRRWAILPPVISGVFYNFLLYFIIVFNLSPWYILVGSFIEGVGGSYQLMLVGIYSYIADTTAPENRRFRITLIGIILMATATLSPIAFGYWIRYSGYIWPALFTLAVRVVNLVYALYFVPETVVRKASSATAQRPQFFTLTHLRRGIAVFTSKGVNGRRWRLATLITAFLICFFADNEMGIDTLFELNAPLCWSSVTIGYYMTVYLAVSSIGGTVVAWVMKYCASDVTTAIIAGAMAMVHYIYKGFITQTYQMFLTSGFAMFSLLFIPSIRTLVSQLVSSSEQGAVFGALGLAEVVCGFLGGIFFNFLYSRTLWISPGFTFIIVGFCYAIGTAVLVGYVLRLRCLRNEYSELETLDDDGSNVTSSRAATAAPDATAAAAAAAAAAAPRSNTTVQGV